MADQVEEVKSKTDIVSVISERVDLKKTGSNFKGLCPFHSEKTPSFMVSPELQIFKCFGCGASGDVFTFLQDYEGMEFYEALNHLAERAGVKLKPRQIGKKGEKEKFYNINSYANYFYKWVLFKHPSGEQALHYLKKDRGLKEKTIKAFELGFSPDVPFALKKYIVDKKNVAVSDLERAGLVYKKNGTALDRFRGRVIFPLYDHRGNTVGFAGRILPKDSGRDLAKYINTPETPVYHKSDILYGLNITKGDIKRSKEAVVMEGELDIISSWQAGIKNAVAIKGSALTEAQVRLLTRFAKKITLCLDADLAGDTAARRGISIAEAQGIEVSVVRLKGFKDPDDAARSDPKALKRSIKEASGVWDFIFDSTFDKYKGGSGANKAKISRELVPVVAAIEDSIVQAHYAGELAKRLGVGLEAVSDQVEKTRKKDRRVKDTIEEIQKGEDKSRQELVEERVLALAFRFKPEMLLNNNKLIKKFKSPFSKRIVEELAKYKKGKSKFELSDFADSLPDELVRGFADIILREIPGVDSDRPEKLEKELKLVAKELAVLEIKQQLNEMAGKIRELENEKEKKKLQNAERRFSLLTKKLNQLEEEELKGIIL